MNLLHAGVTLLASVSLMGSTTTLRSVYPATSTPVTDQPQISFIATTEPVTSEMSFTQIKQLISHYSELYGVSYDEMYRIAECESNFSVTAWNKTDPYGGAKGIYQYLQPTWDYYSAEVGIEKSDIWNPEQQIRITAYLLSKNKGSLWTCYRNLMK